MIPFRIPSEIALFWLFIAMMLFSFVGYFIYRTAKENSGNGWDALPEGKKRNVSAAGIFASMLAGMLVIWAIPVPTDSNAFIKALCATLAAQITVGWSAVEFLKYRAKIMFGGKGGSSGTNDSNSSS